MKGFEPTLFDKLFFADEGAGRQVRRFTIEELKQAVARDIESLLNTRMVFSEDRLVAFPQIRRSVLTYGMDDFSGRSLASHYDRLFICTSLENAIARHEPRLRNVKVALEVDVRATAVLFFAISAVLDVGPVHEPVTFDATLQPTTLQYEVSRGRSRSAGAELLS